MLLVGESPQVCREVVAQFQTEFGPPLPGAEQQHIVAYSFRLQNTLAEANIRLQNACERLQQMEADNNMTGKPTPKYEEM